ncbi:EAL domain-containing protein [Bacillus luteolus]|uniref:EAL domain-containing protein n=1 Tax=Litchfieldia luteola TaxID=682179 RepID=A0ABR9QJ96_9BACI|nr:EAL domain-containing protein [Cytobacillus luteolus]MBE4908573.1 EAL domain-containing protein [Cytobacillus luteolus]MBP1941428.1 EAL domain-containing protein (putative c-di-GMP-specific phosphodiesterase class I) [Cytobacillus luteolus]
MICDVCQPKERGYTVFFSVNQNIDQLIHYFCNYSETFWKQIDDHTFWMVESVLYDLMDYLEAHMDIKSIYAVQSEVVNPLENVKEKKLLSLFKAEREAIWVDDVIKNRSICTHYQPIVGIEEGQLEIVGQELLSRGLDETGKIIPPFKMFEAARIRNRVFSLDRTCRLEAVRNASVVGDKLIFINFIPTAIYVPEHCLASTFELIKQMDIEPEQVVFEVVETDEVKDLNHLMRILNYYRSHGFKYALDDVGVGFNDIETLKKMDPDFVKLAIEFTNGVSKDPSKQKVAKRVLSITHEMGALALAEGVESKEDLAYLIELGYDLFQGYYFSKPQPAPIVTLDNELIYK